MAKQVSAVDFVLSQAAELYKSQPKRSWFSKLPKDAQQRLSEVKQAFKDGKFSGVSYSVVCTAIENLLKEHKWPVPGNKDTILRWLRSSGT